MSNQLRCTYSASSLWTSLCCLRMVLVPYTQGGLLAPTLSVGQVPQCFCRHNMQPTKGGPSQELGCRHDCQLPRWGTEGSMVVVSRGYRTKNSHTVCPPPRSHWTAHWQARRSLTALWTVPTKCLASCACCVVVASWLPSQHCHRMVK